MRITSKGQVTIPVRILEQAGLMPNTDVEFAYEGEGKVSVFRAQKTKRKGLSRGARIVAHLRAHQGDLKMTTEEIMALTRGED